MYAPELGDLALIDFNIVFFEYFEHYVGSAAASAVFSDVEYADFWLYGLYDLLADWLFVWWPAEEYVVIGVLL